MGGIVHSGLIGNDIRTEYSLATALNIRPSSFE
jgi:hypothetical protein